MNLLVRIVAHKLFALSVIVAVGIWLLVVPALTGALGANPLEKLEKLGIPGEQPFQRMLP